MQLPHINGIHPVEQKLICYKAYKATESWKVPEKQDAGER